MHDGVGQWIKSAVARAILAGMNIMDVEDFFKYCVDFLSTNARHKHNFTSFRKFYLVSLEHTVQYRMTMPSSVTG